MTIMRYRPIRSAVTPLNELVNGIFGRDIAQFLGNDDLPARSPRVNIIDRDSEFRIDVVAPGFDKSDLKLNVQDDVLTISAEKKTEDLTENERFTRREFAVHSFERAFHLPEAVNAEGIKAGFANGILTVSIPKTEPGKPQRREVRID